MAVTKTQVLGGVRSGGSSTSASLTITLPNPVASGATIHVGFGWSVTTGVGSLTSITDDKSNTYTIAQNNNDAFSGATGGTAYCLNVTNAAKIITITVGSTLAAGIAIGGCVYELSAGSLDVNTTGAATANPLNATFTTGASGEFGCLTNFSSTSTGTYTQNNGWTQDFTESVNGSFYFSNALASSGANSCNATGGATYHNAWAVLTYQPVVNLPAPIFGTILM
jgi:hypothetical protein